MLRPTFVIFHRFHNKDDHLHQFLLSIYKQQNINQLDKVVQEFVTVLPYFLPQNFHYHGYYFSFYSNWFIIFNTKIFSKLVCLYHAWNNLASQFVNKILTKIHTFIIINPLIHFFLYFLTCSSVGCFVLQKVLIFFIAGWYKFWWHKDFSKSIIFTHMT